MPPYLAPENHADVTETEEVSLRGAVDEVRHAPRKCHPRKRRKSGGKPFAVVRIEVTARLRLRQKANRLREIPRHQAAEAAQLLRIGSRAGLYRKAVVGGDPFYLRIDIGDQVILHLHETAADVETGDAAQISPLIKGDVASTAADIEIRDDRAVILGYLVRTGAARREHRLQIRPRRRHHKVPA